MGECATWGAELRSVGILITLLIAASLGFGAWFMVAMLSAIRRVPEPAPPGPPRHTFRLHRGGCGCRQCKAVRAEAAHS